VPDFVTLLASITPKILFQNHKPWLATATSCRTYAQAPTLTPNRMSRHSGSRRFLIIAILATDTRPENH